MEAISFLLIRLLVVLVSVPMFRVTMTCGRRLVVRALTRAAALLCLVGGLQAR